MSSASAQLGVEQQRRETRQFRWLVFAVFLLALAVRLAYLFGARVDYPIRGDIVQYVNYAWNMVNHGTFSMAAPGAEQVPADAFRGPGYPALLALSMWLAGAGKNWYILAVIVQVVIGALLAPLATAWARLWLARGAALCVGFLVALWPHMIVLAGTLLSETVFCASLLLFLYLSGLAERFRNEKLAVAAGFAGGMAYLVNPLAVFFPPAVAALLFLRRQRRVAVVMFVMFAVLAGAWAVRNAMHPGMQGARDRAAVNFVEGSWPLYHKAVNARFEHAEAAEMIAAITAEERLMVRAPGAGVRAVAARIAADPVWYAKWYLLEKPYSLWGWWIAIGWGDVYFLQTTNSPFDRQLVFRAIHESFRYANPAFFGLAVLAAVITFVRHRRDPSSEAFSVLLAAGFFLYVSVVHTLLQADPRYAVAYRPMEIALAVTACVAIARYLSSRRQHQERP
jgi:4-amino-4-deoxy-L-arabinose transferase-like glycosyltransferase